MNVIDYEVVADGNKIKNYIISDEFSVIQVEVNQVCPDVAFLFGLNVKKDFRGKGIGVAILDYALDYIINDIHCKVASLEVDADSWVRDWYKRKGFVDVLAKSSDRVLMMKCLN